MRGKEKKLCFGFVKCFMEGRHFTSLQLPTFFLVCVCSESPNILLVIQLVVLRLYMSSKNTYMLLMYGGTKVKS